MSASQFITATCLVILCGSLYGWYETGRYRYLLLAAVTAAICGMII